MNADEQPKSAQPPRASNHMDPTLDMLQKTFSEKSRPTDSNIVPTPTKPDLLPPHIVKSISDAHSRVEPLPTHLVESIVAINSKVDLIKMLSRKKVEAQIKCENLGAMNTPIDGEARIQAVIAFDLARYEYIEANRALEAALQQP